MAIDAGDTAWVMISTALVFIMTPGVAFFYGGMLRKSNFLSMLGQSIIIIGVVTLIWVGAGFSLAFGNSGSSLIGNFDYVGLANVGLDPLSTFSSTIPFELYMLFQLMFAIITVALIIGGIAERMKLWALTVFLGIWTLIVYVPVAHWVWGFGWLYQLGALDFAGGTVVHITAGVSVLAAVLVLGKRISAMSGSLDQAHNIPFVVLGGALLWFGWFGFNGGSALAANGLAVSAITVTMIAGATAAVIWGLINWIHLGRVSVLGMITGGVVGLVAITPASGYVAPIGAIFIGALGSMVSYSAILLRRRLGFDDALDVWACHGMGGTTGALLTGLFATTAVNAAGKNGLFYGGGFSLLASQLIAVAAVWAFAFGLTFGVLKIMSKLAAIRMTREEERVGADLIQHGERAYT